MGAVAKGTKDGAAVDRALGPAGKEEEASCIGRTG